MSGSTSSATSAFDASLDRWFRPLLIIGIAVNASGLWVTLMEPDAALYATIARNMAESGNFLDLIARGGEDWLDKPHLPFWVTALSFRALGVGTVPYKLPALLFWALAPLYTYLLALRCYGRSVARLAVLFVLTALHLVMSNNDVRAEPYLVGTIAGALYHFVRASERRWSWHLVVGALWTAVAMMTKGPFVAIPIAGGLIVHWVVRRQWSQLWHPRWWAAVLLVLLFITPELYSLYQQFDLHPEKLVFGRTGVSGVRFFFWDSQFGRFLNTGPIRGKGSPFFFLHTVLWAFLPWSLWLYAAVGARVIEWRRGTPAVEAYSWGAAGLTFLVFSASRFQLPHYLNVVFPFFAIITAQWVYRLASERGRTIAAGVGLGVAALVFLAAALLVWSLPPERPALAAAWIAAVLLVSLAAFRGRPLPAAVGISFGAAVALHVTLNVFFYPSLMRYQAGSEAARFVDTLPPLPLGQYGVNSYALEFYSDASVHRWDLDALRGGQQPRYVFLMSDGVAELQAAGLELEVLRRFPYYRVSRLSPAFMNPTTREGTVRQAVIAEVKPAR